MKNQWTISFILLILVSLIVFISSIYDIIYNKNIYVIIFTLYGLLFIVIIILYIFIFFINKKTFHSIKTFKKTLYGRLYHFKCPHCNGIFAIKESVNTSKNNAIITCPDCGKLGLIQPAPPIVFGAIPEKKSKNVIFQCINCGESLKLWAEGKELYPILNVFSCPFCGKKKPLKRI